MKKIVKNVTLSLITNDVSDLHERVSFDGSLTVKNNWMEVAFAESAPKRPKARNTRVYDGEMLTMVVKPDGSYQLHTKNINPMKVEDFAQRMYIDACALMDRIKGRA